MKRVRLDAALQINVDSTDATVEPTSSSDADDTLPADPDTRQLGIVTESFHQSLRRVHFGPCSVSISLRIYCDKVEMSVRCQTMYVWNIALCKKCSSSVSYLY